VDFTGSSLVVSKQATPKPESLRDFDDTPFQSILEPHSSTSERFRLALPAMVNNYVRRLWLEQRTRFTREYKATALRETNRMKVVIGILQLQPGMRLIRSWHSPDVYWVEGTDPEREQVVLSKTVVLPEAIKLFDYEEQPPRTSP
jgi:hypothetical protein